VEKLLTRGNPKIEKGTKRGFLTHILHLAPHKLSGYNVCASATPGCIASCLNTAGRGGMFGVGITTGNTGQELVDKIHDGSVMNKIQAARIRKTKLYFEDRDNFLALLVADIERSIKYAAKKGLTPVFRLNGTSDVKWENVAIGKHKNIFAMFPNVQFYCYTKHSNRKDLPANYSLTFSRAESNENKAIEALSNGMNVAVVFNTPKGKALPDTYLNHPVIDGDKDDLRFLDPKRVIVGLRAKGKAKTDTSGFVVKVS
jgi:hypothetical protein